MFYSECFTNSKMTKYCSAVSPHSGGASLEKKRFFIQYKLKSDSAFFFSDSLEIWFVLICKILDFQFHLRFCFSLFLCRYVSTNTHWSYDATNQLERKSCCCPLLRNWGNYLKLSDFYSIVWLKIQCLAKMCVE